MNVNHPDFVTDPQFAPRFVQAVNAQKAQILAELNRQGAVPVAIRVDTANPACPAFCMTFDTGVEVRIPIQVTAEGLQH